MLTPSLRSLLAQGDTDSPDEERVPRKVLKAETAAARQAFEDFARLGAGATHDQLVAHYVKCQEAYEAWVASGAPLSVKQPGIPPTTSAASIKKWSMEHNWEERLYLRAAREAELLEEAELEELRKQKKARIIEAQGLRACAVAVVREMLTKIGPQGQGLKEIPLVGRMVYPDKGKPYRVDGLVDMLPKVTRAFAVAVEIERKETGAEVNEKLERLVELLIQDMTPEEACQFRQAARQIAQGG